MAAGSVLALTDSDRESNFRRSVWPKYKCHREEKSDGRPTLYKALRQWIRETYDVHQKPGIEADDTVGIMATMPQQWEPVICSVDKDLHTVPGLHFNWRKQEDGLYYVNEEQAFWAHMTQTMIGDSTDHYPGIPLVGPVKASRLTSLWSELPPWAVWEEIVATGADHGVDEDHVLAQARCAYILHASHWDVENQAVILWTPPEEDTENE
jgi:DNA polymerase-1